MQKSCYNSNILKQFPCIYTKSKQLQENPACKMPLWFLSFHVIEPLEGLTFFRTSIFPVIFHHQTVMFRITFNLILLMEHLELLQWAIVVSPTFPYFSTLSQIYRHENWKLLRLCASYDAKSLTFCLISLLLDCLSKSYISCKRWAEGPTDRQTDGGYQVHYLPASLSYAVDWNSTLYHSIYLKSVMEADMGVIVQFICSNSIEFMSNSDNIGAEL